MIYKNRADYTVNLLFDFLIVLNTCTIADPVGCFTFQEMMQSDRLFLSFMLFLSQS